MNKHIKKLLCAAVSLAMVSGTVILPMSASAAVGDTRKYDFGATAADGWTQVTAADAYTDAKGYGFLGQDGAYVSEAVVDGFTQTAADKTEIKDGGTGETTDYVYTEEKNMPIRFAAKVEPNTYYKVKVTMGHSDKDSKIYLTSERRHFVELEKEIKAGEEFVKEFTVAVHNVQWKNRVAKTEPVYTDDKLNICVLGENPTLCSIEITQIAKPKVAWIFGDSTVTDSSSGVPWIGFDTYTGWGAAVAQYLPSDIAVVNLGEGGLNTSNTAYFDVGSGDITAGDIVVMQMGHNDSSTDSYKTNMESYYTKTTSKDATFVLCAPIERLSNASTQAYATAAQEFATDKDTPFVSLFQVTKDIYTELGDTGKWYSHTALWEGSAKSPKAKNDETHLNDYGASMTTKGLFEEMAKLVEADGTKYAALAPYVTAQADVNAMEPDDAFMKNGGTTVVKPPHSGFPYPEASIDYANMVDVTDVITDGNKITGMDTVRHSNLGYITAFAATYTSDGTLSEVYSYRMEPMAAKTPETINFAADNRDDRSFITIPDGGSYKTFIWGGAFADNSMTYQPYSGVFSGYDVKAALETTGDDAVKSFAPVTSGKVMAHFTYTLTGDNGVIAISPNADGSNGIVLNVTGSTGAVAIDGIEDAVMEGLTKGTTHDITLIYDIDYGILTINVKDVGIMDIPIPNSVTMENGLNPAKIASVNITNATAEGLTVSTLNTDALPTQNITVKYDNTLGTVEAPATATKNEKITLQATPATDDTGAKHYAFGGWYLLASDDDETGTLISKDAQIELYAVDDLNIRAFFYEQSGLEGVADYDVKVTGEDASNIIKVGEADTTVTLDIDNVVDEYGNPTLDFDHAANVTYALKGTPTGVTVSGSTVTIKPDAAEAEEIKSVTVTATCNNVSKDYTLYVHNCTNLLFGADFQNEDVNGDPAWNEDSTTNRYLAKYGEDNGNIYVDFAAENNNGTTRYKKYTENTLTGIVEAKMDVSFTQPTGKEATRVAHVGFRDNAKRFAVAIQRFQSQNDYWINGDKLTTNPGDGWATLTAVMNYTTKTADITLTSLDGQTEYYNKTDVPFFSADAANFDNVAFETNRYNATAKFDNIFINQIADTTETITATPAEVQIPGVSSTGAFNVSLPENWKVTKVESGDATVLTAAVDNTDGTKINITPVAEGETTVKVTAGLESNKYIKSSVTVPVSIKAMDNANLASLSVKNGTSELIDGFAKETTDYTAKTTVDAKTIVVTPVCDNSQATAVVKYNGADVPAESGAATVTLVDGTDDITVEVTAADAATKKTYTITLDKSYLVAETFNADPGQAWGFTGTGGTKWNAEGKLNVIPNSNAGDPAEEATKTFDADVSELTKVHVTFDWQSLVESGKGRHSNFILQDTDGNLVFLLRGVGDGKIMYSTTTADNTGYKDIEAFTNNWYSIDLTLDFTAHTITGAVKDNTGKTLKEFTGEAMNAAAANLGKLYATNTYSASDMAIDNFYVSAAE